MDARLKQGQDGEYHYGREYCQPDWHRTVFHDVTFRPWPESAGTRFDVVLRGVPVSGAGVCQTKQGWYAKGLEHAPSTSTSHAGSDRTTLMESVARQLLEHAVVGVVGWR